MANVYKDITKIIKQMFDARFSNSNLSQHWDKHEGEMRGMTKADYDRRSEALSLKPTGGTIVAYKRPDGKIVKFNKATNEMVVYRGDAVITYFYLNGGAKTYYFRRDRDNGKDI